MAAVGGYVTLEIRGTNSSVSECDTVIRLDRQYTDCTVAFSQNFKAAEGYDPANCYNAKDHTVTVKAVRAGGRPVKDGNLIATVKVKVPDNLTASSTFLYEVRSGMCYNMDGDLTTFSAPAVTLPVGAAMGFVTGLIASRLQVHLRFPIQKNVLHSAANERTTQP